MQPSHSSPPGIGRLPDFLCLGTQRGGTTFLQRLLERHPLVCLPACKEVHYFSLHAAESTAWYAAHYKEARPEQLCGDITPYYLFHPEASMRISSLLPEAKLIVLLRDPVERALSQYFHSVQLGLEHLSLEEALAAEPARLFGAEAVLREPGGRHPSHQEHSYVSRSRYGGQLSRYEALYPQRQILLLRSEDLFQRPQRVWRRLERFLGLVPVPLPQIPERANASGLETAAVPHQVRNRLKQQLLPTYALMRRFYGIAW
jgi:hypothetical protein